MKSSPRVARLLSPVGEAIREAGAMAMRRRRLLLAGWAVLLTLVVWLLPRDHALHQAVMHERPDRWARLARFGRDWGKFIDTSLICGGLWGLGVAFRRSDWRRLALAAFLAASCAGLSANVFRSSIGRARPHANEPLRFVGPSLRNRYQSLPSAHAATSSGYAAALAVAHPVAALPAVLSGGLVVWSSFYAGSHYLSDVLAGTGLGITMGGLFGAALRRRKPRDGPVT